MLVGHGCLSIRDRTLRLREEAFRSTPDPVQAGKGMRSRQHRGSGGQRSQPAKSPHIAAVRPAVPA